MINKQSRYALYIFCAIIFFIPSSAQNVIPTGSSTQVTQSENSVFISRQMSNPPEPLSSTFTVLNSNNSTDWAQTTLCDLSSADYNYTVTQGNGADGMYSIDGGVTWQGDYTGLPQCTDYNQGDPSVVMDAYGTEYIAYVSNSTSLSNSPTFVNVANYNNLNPAITVGSSTAVDKDDLWIDNNQWQNGHSNPYYGRLYLAWTNLQLNPSPIYFADLESSGWVNDGSISTYSSAPLNRGANIRTGPNGEVYVCWGMFNNASPPVAYGIGFAKSIDGGGNWTIQGGIFNFPSGTVGAEANSPYNINMKANSFPSMAVNQQNGHIFIVYTDYENWTWVVRMISSVDGGEHWGGPWVVASAMGFSAQWQPWITCDETSGTLAVIYYAESCDPYECDGPSVYPYVSVSYNEGYTWITKQLSGTLWGGGPIPNNSVTPNGYAGDYLGIDAFAGQCVPVWSDNVSGGNQTSCNSNEGNMLAYSKPFSILCNPNSWNLDAASTNYIENNNAFYQSQQDVIAGGGSSSYTLENSSYTTMISATQVDLRPGFSALNGCQFDASIAECSTTPPHKPEKNPPISDSIKQYNSSEVFKIQNKELLNIYPNPTSGSFTLQLTQTPANSNLDDNHIYIFNIYGQLVYQTTTPLYKLNIDLSGQPAGVYLVKVQSGNTTFNKKLVLR